MRLMKAMMLWSSVSPAQRTLRLDTMPDRLMTATSAVPPPMSTIMLPMASVVGRPAPMAAAIGSSITVTWRAPASGGSLAHSAALDLGNAGGHAE